MFSRRRRKSFFHGSRTITASTSPNRLRATSPSAASGAGASGRKLYAAVGRPCSQVIEVEHGSGCFVRITGFGRLFAILLRARAHAPTPVLTVSLRPVLFGHLLSLLSSGALRPLRKNRACSRIGHRRAAKASRDESHGCNGYHKRERKKKQKRKRKCTTTTTFYTRERSPCTPSQSGYSFDPGGSRLLADVGSICTPIASGLRPSHGSIQYRVSG